MGFAVRRTFSTSAARLAVGAGSGSGHGSMSMWKKTSFFVAFPAIGLAMVNAYIGEMEHLSHDRAKFVPYEHLRIRTKAFPWGDGNKSLFHNPKTNALPEGYEDEVGRRGRRRRVDVDDGILYGLEDLEKL